MEAVDLFGNKIINIIPHRKIKKTLFDDYDGFVEKFEVKKTTDDCYTPQEVYACILRYVSQKIDISGLEIIRPFYPGGDFENIDYSSESVVIDNPPFSIISKIARYYINKGIKFFLFAPHMTLFSADIDCTAIVCGADVVYENGAKVKTSFLSNMFGDVRILGGHELYLDLEILNKSGSNQMPKYKYPPNLLTVSMVHVLVQRGIPIQFHKSEVHHCPWLDMQKKYKKTIFGSGFLLSEKATAEKVAAEEILTGKAATAEKANIIEWELSEREKYIINSLF